jgi:hypothetical protein
MRANEFINEEPRTAASKPEIVSVQDDGKTITIKVRAMTGLCEHCQIQTQQCYSNS